MIQGYSFGEIKVGNECFNHDVYLNCQGQAIPWQRQTSHWIDLNDIKEFLEEKPDIVIIGTGKWGVAKVSEKVFEWAKEEGINLIVEKTSLAVQKYNELISKESKAKMVGFFHLTC